MSGRVDHLLAPEEPYVRTSEERGESLSLTEAIYLVAEECQVIEISWELSLEELHDLGSDQHVFLSQSAMKKRAEVFMRNASPE